MKKSQWFGIIFLTHMSILHAGGAEQVTGIIQVTGSSFNRKTVFTETNHPKSSNGELKSCKSKIASQMRLLSGMTVAAKGSINEKTSKRTKKKRICFQVEEFTILKVSSGRDAIVGLLDKNPDGSFSIKTEKGEKKLHGVSEGLKKLISKKVILDATKLKQGDQIKWKIVSYAEFPQ